MSAPASVVQILDVPLNNRYDHTYYFEDKAEQSAFFQSKVVRTFTAYTYVRKNWDLRVEATLETAIAWRYLTFRNTSDGKQYYYFITNVEYVNDATVLLSLEMDVMQTYAFDYGLRHSFVERQHAEYDAIGESTTDEGLDIGDLINAHVYNCEDIQEMCCMVLSTFNVNASTKAEATIVEPNELDGVYSGLRLYATDDFGIFRRHMRLFNEWGFTEAIVAMWMYPKALVSANWDATYDGDFAVVDGAGIDEVTIAHYLNYNNKLFEGYTPRNNKLYCFPYNFLYVTNNAGNSANYKYEFIDNPLSPDLICFNVYGGLTPDSGVKIAPVGYMLNDSSHSNYDEGFTLGNYPSVAWNCDTYKIWLAQNTNTIRHQMQAGQIATATAGVATLTSLVSGNVAGIAQNGMSLISSVHSVYGTVATANDMRAHPPHAGGEFVSSVNVSAGRQTFTFYYKTLRAEKAKIVDDFFTMYGYKVSRVMIPNTHARERFTYVKTLGCNLVGRLCASDLSKIASIFDKGITFWADKDGFLLYGDNPTLN